MLYLARGSTQSKGKTAMQVIYCDEAGYTGNKLFDAGQPYFTYASVATTNDEARVVLQEAIARFRLQMPEIKGAKLVKSNRGKDAALFILSQFYQQSLMSEAVSAMSALPHFW